MLKYHCTDFKSMNLSVNVYVDVALSGCCARADAACTCLHKHKMQVRAVPSIKNLLSSLLNTMVFSDYII